MYTKMRKGAALTHVVIGQCRQHQHELMFSPTQMQECVLVCTHRSVHTHLAVS